MPPPHDLGLAGQIHSYIPDLHDLYDLAHVPGWELYDLNDLL